MCRSSQPAPNVTPHARHNAGYSPDDAYSRSVIRVCVAQPQGNAGLRSSTPPRDPEARCQADRRARTRSAQAAIAGLRQTRSLKQPRAPISVWRTHSPVGSPNPTPRGFRRGLDISSPCVGILRRPDSATLYVARCGLPETKPSSPGSTRKFLRRGCGSTRRCSAGQTRAIGQIWFDEDVMEKALKRDTWKAIVDLAR